MTTIEKKIYHLLNRDKVDPINREAIALLYAKAFNSSHRIYSCIEWDQLHTRMKEKLGLRALNHIKRQALKPE